MAERCLIIVGICLNSREVSVEDLVESVPTELVEAIVEERSEH